MGIIYHLIANMSNLRGLKFAFLSSYAPDLPEMQTVMARLPPTGDAPVLQHLCLPHRNASWLESAPIDVSRLQSLRCWVSWGTKDPVLEDLLERAKDTLSVFSSLSVKGATSSVCCRNHAQVWSGSPWSGFTARATRVSYVRLSFDPMYS